ncbi:hypothetical protein [Chlamydia caviae]|uniref:Sperm tail-specific-like protein n=1 Tax=Chlamydia caviae (strain ATCC VR-813 / DSM 19441 / 03DC25 / GPIC) TaxID=227941 RepID=Q823Q6_CHLCV|nr:hypothetical protein [Chlamydia caviae]AAP05098.1 conserved hypothetical protein [Chlamydia caviae GPIC]
MMSSKRTSQLAMLSILLTFTHSVGYASAAVPPFEVSSVYSEDSLIALESEQSNQSSLSRKEKKLNRIQEGRAARKEARKAAEAKKNARDAARKAKQSKKLSFSFNKLNRKPNVQAQAKEQKEQQKVFAQQVKDGVNYCREKLVEYGTENLLTRGGRFFKRQHKVNNPDQNTVAAPEAATPGTLLKAKVDSETKASSENKEAIQVVHDIKDGPVLPIFVRPDVKVVHEERSKLIQDLAREQRITKRKSSREALQARAKENKILRDGKITSTLRYDVEKAAAVKVKRNGSVNPQVRAQKASNTRRSARSEQNQQESAQNSADQKEQTASNTSKDDFYRTSSAAGNTNIDSYLNAKQYRCDSSESDWPCSSCVAKRRTHTSISVCTMVVTVIAMIVGAIIIANASDSTPANGGTNPTPPTP